MSDKTRVFTSECVSDGHPDKVCDQISDAILDECLRQDPMSRVAIEAAVKGDTVMVFGELTTNAELDISKIVRTTLSGIGYDDPQWMFDPWKVKQIHNITEQSREIGDGVTGTEKLGAGDQGLMFGYACNETPEMMPLPLMLARAIISEHKQARSKNGFFGPDAKSQVTVRYDSFDEPIEIDTVVLSSVHEQVVLDRRPYRQGALHPETFKEHRNLATMESYLREIIHDGLKDYSHLITPATKFITNPAGQWTIGGPVADSGLTGRKIIVDTYGGMARHGGGAFSGKDPTKVDRSAAYAARHLAKSICKATGRMSVEVQVSYAIGVAEPVSVYIEGMDESEINDLILGMNIDLSPQGIIDRFNLRSPIYLETAARGHFGHEHYAWEQV